MLEFLITINPDTGTGTEVGVMCLGVEMITTDLSVRNADDDLFGNLFDGKDVCLVGASNGIAPINTSTGAANPLGLSSGQNGCCGNALAFSPADTLFFGDDADLYTVNQGNGALTMISKYELSCRST